MSKPNPGRCTAQVWPDGGGHYPCKYGASVTREGKGYCLKHDPARLRATYEARQTRQNNREKRENEERERLRREHEAFGPMLAQCKLTLEQLERTYTPHDPKTEGLCLSIRGLRAVIAKAEGREVAPDTRKIRDKEWNREHDL